MRKMKKFLMVVLVINVLINVIYLFKGEVNAGLLDDMISQSGNFINTGTSAASNSFDVSTITDAFKEIGQILTYIGAGVLVAVISYMGIKYLISTPDKQAALKQQLIGVVVSGIVIFGAYGIWSAVLNIVSRF